MEELNKPNVGRWAGSRALSMPMAAIILVVVILVVGGLGYVGLNSTKSSPVSLTTCAPSTSAACIQGSAAHDIVLQVPYKSVQQGNPVPFTATLPNGETATSYTFNFGDGSAPTNSTSPTVDHTFASPGTYIISATGVVAGAVHDSYKSLVILTVSASFTSSNSGSQPGVTGQITSNTSTSTGATAILQPGDSASFAGSYSSAPTNPLYSLEQPTIVGPSGVSPTTNASSASSASATYTFANSGTYWVTFVGMSSSSTGKSFQNYTWSVFVAPNGFHAGSSGSSTTTSPHKGSLIVYEDFPGGSQSEDPAIDYETVGYEPIVNVYESLIAYNGSQTGPTPASYVPVIATCVPGSTTGANNCASLYSGNSLVSGSNYTFVISKSASFYDPATKKGWGVWPSDVLFSIARTMAFSTNPGVGANNGWILTQSLLSVGNYPAGSLHQAFNNTPAQVFSAVTVNGTDCPAVAMTSDHGCVTFNADANGLAWPYFLELIADPEGGAIVPCGWFSADAQGAGIPDWTQGNVHDAGDHPCGMPGSPGYGEAVSSMGSSDWDAWELAGSVPPFVGNVQFNMLGSGPYYMSDFRQAASYSLQANPSYAPNPYCSWTGCWPQAGKYTPTVSVTWETNQVPGEQAYASGTADLASIPATDAAFMLQLIQAGKISATSFPSISIYFYPFDLAFNLLGAHTYTSNPITVQSDFFSNVGVRQFFAHAYPYNTIEQTIATKDGIQYLFNYGGAIPQFLANYYPTNVSFPTGDPSTDAAQQGTAAWWWSQITTVGTPYYDANLTACTTSSVCELPFFSQTGDPSLDLQTALWASEISSLSGGRLKMDVIDINFVTLVINSLYSGPYNDPMPFYTLGWAPDYPDPTDYVSPLYLPGGSYPGGDALANQLANPLFDAASCHGATNLSDFAWWSNEASTVGIPNACQGEAYTAMNLGMSAAAVLAAGPQRVLYYDMVEQIANGLALYTYWGQENQVVTTASWIDPTSYNSNVTIGGGTVSTWFTITGNGLY